MQKITWRRGTLAMVAAMALGAFAGPAQAVSYDIQLLGETLTPSPATAATENLAVQAQAEAAQAAGHDSVHVLVQLHEVPDEAGKAELWRQGLDLATYVSGNAWIATVPVSELAEVATLDEVRWVGSWSGDRKVHPRIQADEWGDWAVHPTEAGMVMVFVQFHRDQELGSVSDLIEAVDGVALPPVQGLHGMTVWVPRGAVASLAASEAVLWIEEGPAPLSNLNDGSRESMYVDTLHASPFNLDGTGVRPFVFDGGSVRATHETFDPGTGSRATIIDGAGTSSHATHVAGTVTGDGSGSAGGRAMGMAPAATLLSGGYSQGGGTMLFWDNAGDIEADYTTARNTHDADLSNNSIGSNTANNGYPCSREGDYGVTSAMIDGIVRGDNISVGSEFLVIWANGNERSGGSPRGRCGGGYVTTAPPSCAKNPIHVGALYSDGNAITTFTSWGPCDDGRLRPVISGSGCETGLVTGEAGTYSSTSTNDSSYGTSCGTSMSSPAVTGVATLFIQDWRAQGHGGATDRPMPALVKAMMVQTADDLGVNGPDYMTGYGNVNAEALIDLLRTGDISMSAGAAFEVAWMTDSVSAAGTDSSGVVVPEGTAVLKATLAWDDVPGAAFVANALVNDLDLELVSPGGAVTHLPFILDPANPHLGATTGVNTRDNQEQIVVENPEPGTWTVRVIGTTVPVGPQTYGLTWQAIPADSGACDERVLTRDFESGTDGWVLSGEAQRTAAPSAGHGSFSMELGGAASLPGRAHLVMEVPEDGARSYLTYWWQMATDEGSFGAGFDNFLVEVRDLADNPLRVFDIRSDAWTSGEWMKGENIDLSPWAGQQVQIVFRATNNTQRPTTFWFDDVSLSSCGSPDSTKWVGFETGDLSGWSSAVP